jgi:hypothetical protein
VEECAGFPNAAHDDQVDACTQALAKIGAIGRKIVVDVPVSVEEDFSPGFDSKTRSKKPRWMNPYEREYGNKKWRTPGFRRNGDDE